MRLWRPALAPICALSMCSLALMARTKPLSSSAELVTAVASPYAPLLALTALAWAALHRRILLSVSALALAAITLAVQIQWYYMGDPPEVAATVGVRVLSANLRKGEAVPEFIVNVARADADVIMVSELTPEEARNLVKAGIEAVFPYALLDPKPRAEGIGLWSRFPLKPLDPPTRHDVSIVAARIQVPAAVHDPVVVSLHITSPVTAQAGSFDRWRKGITAARLNLQYFAEVAGPSPVIAAGDFNSTPDMRQFRDLQADGYRDAVEQTGAGWTPTFPSHRWHPPLITIDHLLSRNATASSVRSLYVPGSDHRALVGTIRIPSKFSTVVQQPTT